MDNNINQEKLKALAISIITLEADNYNTTSKTDSQLVGEIVKKIEEVIK